MAAVGGEEGKLQEVAFLQTGKVKCWVVSFWVVLSWHVNTANWETILSY